MDQYVVDALQERGIKTSGDAILYMRTKARSPDMNGRITPAARGENDLRSPPSIRGASPNPLDRYL